MNTSHLDVEVYVKTGDSSAVVSLLSRSIGPLAPNSPPKSELQIYEFESVSVILQPSEDGFASVWVRGSGAWPSCPALGRHLARELRCIVRCDPEREFPEVDSHSNVFLEIDGDKEHLVPWG
jgi:hypothetical protein